MAGPADIPWLVKHMTLAVLRTKGVDTFKDAFQISRGRLVEYGFLRQGSDKGDADNIRLTVKGRRREREHRRESSRKSRQFDALYAKSFPTGGKPGAETLKDREPGEPTEG